MYIFGWYTARSGLVPTYVVMMLRILVCSHALCCKSGVVGLSSRRCYRMAYGEFPSSLFMRIHERIRL
jgi:hypothetical protein